MEMKTMYGAHHEAGHIVIAAVRGLALRPDGLMVISDGNGFCVYSTQPDESDHSRESIILSSFAGYWAAKRFCDKHSCPDLLDPMVLISSDWTHARHVIAVLSSEYVETRSLAALQEILEQQSKDLVDQHWLAIEALAGALLNRDPEPMRRLKTGHIWSDKTDPVRYMDGEEAVQILARHGIAAICESRASDA